MLYNIFRTKIGKIGTEKRKHLSNSKPPPKMKNFSVGLRTVFCHVSATATPAPKPPGTTQTPASQHQAGPAACGSLVPQGPAVRRPFYVNTFKLKAAARSVFHNRLIPNALSTHPFQPPKQAVSACNTGHIALRYRPFRNATRQVC